MNDETVITQSIKAKKNRSFATRMSIYIAVGIIAVFSSVVIMFYVDVSEIIVESAIGKAQSMLRTMRMEVEDKLNNAEIAIYNSEWVVRDVIDDGKLLQKEMKTFMLRNVDVEGVAIAMEPVEGNPDSKKMYYSYRRGGKYYLKQ